jgi:hypothetical protein
MGGLALTSLALPRFGSAVLFPRPSYRQPKTHVRKPSENLDLTRIWRILEQSYWRTLASQLLRGFSIHSLVNYSTESPSEMHASSLATTKQMLH